MTNFTATLMLAMVVKSDYLSFPLVRSLIFLSLLCLLLLRLTYVCIYYSLGYLPVRLAKLFPLFADVGARGDKMFELSVKPKKIAEPTYVILSPTRACKGLWAVSSIALVLPGMVDTVHRSMVMQHLRNCNGVDLLAGFDAKEMEALELFVSGLGDVVADLHVVRFSMMCDVRHLRLNMHSLSRFMGRPMTQARNSVVCGQPSLILFAGIMLSGCA